MEGSRTGRVEIVHNNKFMLVRERPGKQHKVSRRTVKNLDVVLEN